MLTFVARRAATASIASLAVLAACRSQPTPVALQGSSVDIDRLAGIWEGEYSSAQSGRSGVITFTLQAGKDTAYGDVLMMAGAGQPFIAADADTRLHAMHSQAPHLLRVTFVEVRGGIVEGALEPYLAPDCQCVVTTVFRGAVEGDVIRGEYLTTGNYGLRQTGKWSAARKRPSQHE